jgi:hypothetical protein
VWLSRSPRYPGSTFPSQATCLKRKIEQNADGEGRRDWGNAAPNHGGSKARAAHRYRGVKKDLTEIIGLFYPNVSSNCSDETILPSDETIFRFRSRHPETAIGYPVTNEAAHGAVI